MERRQRSGLRCLFGEQAWHPAPSEGCGESKHEYDDGIYDRRFLLPHLWSAAKLPHVCEWRRVSALYGLESGATGLRL